MGLPDNGEQMVNPMDLRDNPNKRDAHRGLLLNKNSPGLECSSAGAEIIGVKGMLVDPTFAVGFDYRVGTHCSGGAPRFNVSYTDPLGVDGFAFREACSLGTHTPSPQYPVEWMQTRLLLSPEVPTGSRIRRIDIVFDEGPETPGTSDPTGVGLAVIDNIFINGVYIRTGSGIAQPQGRRDRDDDDSDSDGVLDENDSDDDNDGARDSVDSDDDGDDISDEWDTRSAEEDFNAAGAVIEPAADQLYEIAADVNSLLLIAVAEAAQTDLLSQPLIVEIINSSGVVVAQSPSLPGRALATAVPLPGNYKIRVRNVSQKSISYTLVSIVRQKWPL
jgi:hypothetical protein